MIRLVFALRRKPGLSREEFQDYWLNKHAPLVASVSSDLDILRYVQTHTLTDPANAAAQSARGDMEPEYDGVAELWWASEVALTANLQNAAARMRRSRLQDAAALRAAALLSTDPTPSSRPESPTSYSPPITPPQSPSISP